MRKRKGNWDDVETRGIRGARRVGQEERREEEAGREGRAGREGEGRRGMSSCDSLMAYPTSRCWFAVAVTTSRGRLSAQEFCECTRTKKAEFRRAAQMQGNQRGSPCAPGSSGRHHPVLRESLPLPRNTRGRGRTEEVSAGRARGGPKAGAMDELTLCSRGRRNVLGLFVILQGHKGLCGRTQHGCCCVWRAFGSRRGEGPAGGDLSSRRFLRSRWRSLCKAPLSRPVRS